LKILITGGKSATALKLIKAFDQHEVMFADYGEIPAFLPKDYQLKSLGKKNEDTLAHVLLSFCLDYGIEAILPLYEQEIIAVSKANTLFNEFGIEILLPEAERISDYFGMDFQYKDWLFFYKGALIFSTFSTMEKLAYAASKNLSGVFYCSQKDFKLQLMTIK
jgi:hypothetical protein